ncbi:hypothetical protein Ctob_011208 [Chrysochromulina tobinii]|uniref:Uncharacterized protein n=1 Tax=Chrysochromulina tobinii TaxID=1460289 RepID=A0A0M0JZ43_9EUKA|nr:hypothetical protein Ctob_011208 [Chrysochromulina tobinii]|eukprot:KOO31834.1 hypothetical protein Ctob_011208 [Chrysochromulina sp. CCMP291]
MWKRTSKRKSSVTGHDHIHDATQPAAVTLTATQRAVPSDDYERDPQDTAEVDTQRVEELLQERTDLRRSRDFDGADRIREQLRDEFSVTVLDKDKLWYVENGGRGRGREGGRDRDRAPSYDRSPQDFGPLGHDYTFVAEESTEPEADVLSKINALIAQRLQAKLNRQFDEADKCKAQLEVIGVRLQDRLREWRFKKFEAQDYGPLGHDYVHATDDAVQLDEQALATINSLLAKRLEAKLQMKYDEADKCKEELNEKFNVFVNDKLRAWRADGGVFPTHLRVEGDGDAEFPVDEAAVLERLVARALARKDGDFEAADTIKEELLNKLHVALDDKAGTWRVVRLYGGYYRVGPRVDEFTEKIVAEKLEKRNALRADRNYDEADVLHAELTAMGISLDTRSRTWRKGEPGEARSSGGQERGEAGT